MVQTTSMGHTDCLYTAGQNFNSWMGMVQPDAERANPIDVNLKYETYCNAIAAGSQEDWDFARDNWDTIKSYYSGFAATFIGRTIKYTTNSFTSKFELQQLKDFRDLRKSELESSTRDVEQAVESVENNVKWMERNYENIWRWLGQKNKETLQ